MDAMGLWKAATRRLGGAGVAGRWRRDIVAVALAVSAAVVLLSFSTPYSVSVWFTAPSAVSSSHITAAPFSSFSSAGAGGDSSFEGSLLPPPLNLPHLPPPSLSSLRQYQDPVASASTPPPSPSIAPLSPLDENSDDEEVEDSAADRKMPPLWRESVDTSNSTVSTATTEPPPVVAPPPPPISKPDAAEVKSSNAEPKVPPLLPEIPVWLMSPDQQLIYAKREIDRAPLVLDDPDLCAPLFRNVSVFKR